MSINSLVMQLIKQNHTRCIPVDFAPGKSLKIPYRDPESSSRLKDLRNISLHEVKGYME